MKKLILLTISIILVFSVTSCSKAGNPFEQTGDIDGYIYAKFMNTDWGMTVKEVMDALGKSESDFEIRTGADSFPNAIGGKGTVYYKTDMPILEDTVQVVFCFLTETVDKNTEPAVGLISVSVLTSDEKTIEMAIKSKETIEKSDKYIGQFEAFNFLEKMDMIDVMREYYEKAFAEVDGWRIDQESYRKTLKKDCEAIPIKDIGIIKNDDGTITIRYDQNFIARYKFFETIKNTD